MRSRDEAASMPQRLDLESELDLHHGAAGVADLDRHVASSVDGIGRASGVARHVSQRPGGFGLGCTHAGQLETFLVEGQFLFVPKIEIETWHLGSPKPFCRKRPHEVVSGGARSVVSGAPEQALAGVLLQRQRAALFRLTAVALRIASMRPLLT